MVDESCNVEAAHLWKILSEDDVEVKCSMFPDFLQVLSNAQSLIEVLTNPVNRSIHMKLEASRFGNHAV
ncbi:hypothetical protein DAPPUDRAFT_235346 [Daphnia pulex]|uniref:Uncharacterized protein n=1 Tax=Daphnia pulex TaxID=6669 RepID=E9FYS9_DAPPU|nr:hypothetical protein DAPPUDRAFT_235346 [Daphnia pulex]|eukprot:EFX87721.1 hypothetical protein DAPPUDRAFT_235346 [Daphnia pulex]